nr:MAG: replication associated protein [Cressdnaviricota sp.]
MSQGLYWLLTIPHADFLPYQPPNIAWIRGQLELGVGGFLHWQIVLGCRTKCRLAAIKKLFGSSAHAELCKSAAADAYVWKDDSAVVGTRFELGEKPISRARPADWDRVRRLAMDNRLEEIPADIYVRLYGNLRRIACDNAAPLGIEKRVRVYWGPTGTGKSRTAWDEASIDAYPKDPRTKFWDGYRGQQHVVIDEFRGDIDISHILRWLDRYPVIVEVKGSSVILKATDIWITSNLHPDSWYPLLDQETKDALHRRLTITHFNLPL